MIGIGPSLASFLMVAGPLLGAVGIVVLAPVFWLPLLLVAAACGVVLLALRHTMVFVVAWLLITGATIEMALLDLVGPSAFQTTIAVEKTAGLLLAAVCALRWGWRLDPLNPAWAFAAMGALGLALGLHPELSRMDNLRSLFGSIAPFAFCFCRLPRGHAALVLATVRWCPVIAVAVGVALMLAGVRPLFVESGGLRLAGLGHPAFLAGVTLVGVQACLIEMFRRDRAADRWLLVVNLVILLLTGARAPLAYAAVVVLLSLTLIPAPAFPAARRGFLILGAVCAVPILIALAGDLSDVRVFHLLATDAGHIARRSGCRLAIELSRVPVAAGVAEVAIGRNRAPLTLACAAGEDYELLATVPPDVALPPGCIEIGRCETGEGAVFLDEAGEPVALRGWELFR